MKLLAPRFLAIAAALIVSSSVLVAVEPAQPVHAATVASDEASALSIINSNRAGRGLGKLSSDPAMANFAHQWAKEYATASVLSDEGPAMAVLPPDGVTGDAPTMVHTENELVGSISYDMFSRAEIAVRTVTRDTVWRKSGFTHGAVGIYQSGTRHLWVVLVLANYPNCIPREMSPITPQITGGVGTGYVHTASTGHWVTNSRTTKYSYEWKIGSTVVGRDKYYIPSHDEAGKNLVVTVGATRDCYRTPLTRQSKPKTILSSNVPVVEGSRHVGETLTVDTSRFGDDGSAFTYQWRRNDAAINGAIGAEYTQTEADLNTRISVSVTATKNATVLTARSAVPPATQSPAFASAPEPTISGSPVYGSTLTAVVPEAEPLGSTVSYQWLIGRSPFQGAIEPTFRVPFAALGHTVSVVVTRSHEGNAPAVSRSEATAPVAKATFDEPYVTTSGTHAAGGTLTASPQTRGVAAIVAYQWLVNGSAVAGETRSFFRVTSANASKSIRVRVTLTRLGYVTAVATSATEV